LKNSRIIDYWSALAVFQSKIWPFLDYYNDKSS